MRTTGLIMITFAVAGLSACATGAGPDSYQTGLQRLESDCAERGGVLTHSGQQTGRPQTDYVCQITGQPSGRVSR